MLVNNNYKKRKSQKRWWSIGYAVFVCLIGASGIFFSYFIYQNIFSALSNAYTVGLLQTTAYIDAVDTIAYDKAMLIIKNKQLSPIRFDLLKNPFFEPNATSTKKSADR